MNEELKFNLTSDTGGVKQGADEAVSSMTRVGKAYTDTAQKGKQSESAAEAVAGKFRQVGQAGASMAAAILSPMQGTKAALKEVNLQLAKYEGMSVSRLAGELDKLSEKIEEQKQKLAEAYAVMDEYMSYPLDVSKYQGNDSAINLAVSTKEYAALEANIEQAEVAMAGLQNQHAACNAALANTSGVEKAKQAAEQLSATNGKARLSVDAVGFALSSIASISGGTVGKLALVAMQVRYLKTAFKEAAVSAGTLGTAMTVGLGALGIASSLISMVVSGVTSSIEREKQKVQELRDEIKEISSNNVSASSLISEYEELANKAGRSADETQRMTDIRAELVEQYGYAAEAVDKEGRLLAGNLETMKEQLATEKERLLLKLQENEQNTEDDFDAQAKKRKKVLEEIAELEKKIANPEKAMADMGVFEYTDEDLQKQVEAWKKAKEDGLNGIMEYDRAVRPAVRDMFQQIILTAQADGEEVPEAVQAVIRDTLQAAYEAGEDYDTAKTLGEDALYRYFQVDKDVILEGVLPEITEIKRQIVASIFSESGGEPSEDTANFVNQLFAEMGADDQAFLAYFLHLKELVASGKATVQQQLDFDEAKARGYDLVDKLMIRTNQRFAENPRLVNQAAAAFNKFKKEIDGTNTSYKDTEKLAKKADDTIKDFANGGEDATKRLADVKNEMKDLGQQRAAIEILKKGQTNTKDYADALEWLSDRLNMDPSQILESLGVLDENLSTSEDRFASYINLIASSSGITFTMDDSGIVAIGNSASESSMKIAEMMNNLLASNGASINLAPTSDGKGVQVSSKIPKFTGGGKKSGGGGGGGGSKNAALEREMALVEHKKALDQLTTQEEINNLERILKRYAKTNDEKKEITEKLYSLRRQKAKEDLEYQKAMDQLTLREELNALDAELATYKSGTQARRELEQERYALAKELQRQEYDLKVYYGQLTLKQQAQNIELMIRDYKKGTQARIDLEKELYDIQQQIRESGIEKLDSITDGVISALENRYAEQQRIETERLEASKDEWKKWGDEQTAAIQKQIDALDELTQEEDREEQERQKRKKIASLEQQLLYENDLYNQKKLQEQLASAKKELDDWLRQKEREDLKKALQEQIDQINDRVDAEQEKLDEQLEANDKYYEELTKEQKLQAEAQKLLMHGSQQDILDLLKNFAPEYNLTGQSLGEQLVDGFMGKVGDIEAWFDGLSSKFSDYQKQIANMATQTANEFYRVHGVPDQLGTIAEATDAVAPSMPQITMIFNQPVESPTEIRREMERLAEQLANL